MQQAWRWFGPDDPVSLEDVRQAGAKGVVTALHHRKNGEAWSDADVAKRKAEVKAGGLTWSVVESIPVSNEIKTRSGLFRAHVEAYRQSIRAVAKAGVKVICYNFMPLIDWNRTDLRYPMPTGGLALRFDRIDFIAFDAFGLRRPGAKTSYPEADLEKAEARFAAMSEERRETVAANVVAALPGSWIGYSRDSLIEAMKPYEGLTPDLYRANLVAFLKDIVPVAEEEGARLCIHPDDPPLPLFGMPRIVGSAEDFRALFLAVPSLANGLTLCVGSLGVRADNDIAAMAKEFGPRIHFAHLRNVTREGDGSFHESDHLGGSVDMVAVVAQLLAEERRRKAEGRDDAEIPMRPDHGHLLLDDRAKLKINPGYSAIGRLKGLAELRGAMMALDWARSQED